MGTPSLYLTFFLSLSTYITVFLYLLLSISIRPSLMFPASPKDHAHAAHTHTHTPTHTHTNPTHKLFLAPPARFLGGNLLLHQNQICYMSLWIIYFLTPSLPTV